MSPLLVLRLVVALVGVAVFLYGVRENLGPARWVGTAFVFVAWILRFWPKPPPPSDSSSAQEEEPT